MDHWRQQQTVPPDRSAVMLTALDRFLDQEGATPESDFVDSKPSAKK